MRMQGRSVSRFFAILTLISAGLAGAQTYYWNPSAPLLTTGSGEAQKAYNWTSNANGTGTYPASALDDDFSANTIGAGKTWTVQNATGNATFTAAIAGGQLTLTGFGRDVWHDTNQYVGVYRADIAGDFDVSVEVVSQTNSYQWAKSGIMMRNTIVGTDSGGFAIVAVTPGHGVTFQYDIATPAGELDVDVNNASITLPCWVRLAKHGSSVTAYYRTSTASAWTQVGAAQTLLNTVANSQIALFSSSHSAATACTAVFDDFTGGGNIASTTLDLNFGGGTGAQAGSDARLTGPLAAKSAVFNGAKVGFNFMTSTLTVSDSAMFGAAKSVTAGTGGIAFTGNGAQKLAPLAGSPLPDITKGGTGTLTLAAFPMTAGLLTLSGGTLNCGNVNQEFAGLVATAGAVTGLDATDTLTFSGTANFAGVTALPAAGSILLRAASGTLTFTLPTAPAAVFNNLILWPQAVGANALVAVGPGSLNLAGNLIIQDEKLTGAGVNGDVDFRVGNPNVTLGGTLSRTESGSGTADKLHLYMGKGTWAIKGDLSVNPPNGLTADSATLDFQANSPALQNITVGAWKLGAIKHSGTGTLNLAQSSATLNATSFSQSAGVLNLNGSSLQTTDSLIVRNGAPGSIVGLGGRELKSAGKISLSGTSASRLGLNPGTAWKATAAGTLNADWADLGGSDASLSAAAGAATANCNDLGGNIHWTFPPTGPSFTLQPASKEVVAGLPVVFKAKAAGTAPITYAWHRQGDTATLSKEDSLYFAKADASQNGVHYYCTAANSVDSTPSLDAILTVDVPPVIDAQPADTIVVAGKTASFTVTAHGSGTLVYSWTKVGDAATVLSRTATLSLDSGAVRKNDGATVICTISNGFGTPAVTRAALLTVKYPPAIARQPADVIGTLGLKATLSVGATGTGPLAFAWTRVGDTAILSKDSLLTLGPLTPADTNSYQCHVANDYGFVDSRAAKLSVVQAATIVREPADMTVGPGRKAYFIAEVAGQKPLTYAWRRKGNAAVIGTDTLLVIDSAKLTDNGAIFIFTATNAYGADTSREAKLSVVACDSVFKITPESLTVDEGQPVKLAGTAACASGREWSVVSGPGPRILDPEADTLAFLAPRVSADSVIVLRFSAQYFGGPVTKDVRVKVREAIPDPKFTLPAAGVWKGVKTYVIRPTVTNAAALKASKYSPPLRYLWSLSAPAADTSLGGDSLRLSNPLQAGNLEVTLCMDNGGSASCVVHTVNIDLLSVSLATRAARLGPVSLSGRLLSWNTYAVVRVWDYRGRILWQGRRGAGASALIPEGAARDLFHGRARLEILR
jgi:hypothetical protein